MGPRSRRTGRGARRDSRGMKWLPLKLSTASFAYRTKNNRQFRTKHPPWID